MRLGEYDTRTTADGPHQDLEISRTAPHKKYNNKFFINDIGLLFLVRDVYFNGKLLHLNFVVRVKRKFSLCFIFFFLDRIRPICLPLSNDIIDQRFVDSTPFLAGWGNLHERAKQMSPVLMQVQLPVVSNDKCKESYEKIGRAQKDAQFSDRVLCTGFEEGGKDSCQGDSGGPVMLPIYQNGSFPFYQIGIVSWGIGCGQVIPGINTNVQYFANWINKTLNGQ